MTMPIRLPLSCRRVFRSSQTYLVILAGIAALLFVPASDSFSGDQIAGVTSNSPVGQSVKSFYVRAITGPLAGKSVCYVCRNGLRPVVLVLLRDLEPQTIQLIKQLDNTVNQHRADGLRCFVVLLSESVAKDSPKLQTIAFDEKLDLPLTIASDTAINHSTFQIPPDAAVTVVFYDELKIIDHQVFRKGECNQTARQAIVDASKKLATSTNEH